jgi:hypothetical protein
MVVVQRNNHTVVAQTSGVLFTLVSAFENGIKIASHNLNVVFVLLIDSVNGKLGGQRAGLSFALLAPLTSDGLRDYSTSSN